MHVGGLHLKLTGFIIFFSKQLFKSLELTKKKTIILRSLIYKNITIKKNQRIGCYHYNRCYDLTQLPQHLFKAKVFRSGETVDLVCYFKMFQSQRKKVDNKSKVCFKYIKSLFSNLSCRVPSII